MSTQKKKVTVISGDGIGPEVVGAALRVIAATGVSLDIEEHEAGSKVFARGIASGVPKETIESIERSGVVLKGPLETPIGYGNKSANVALRTFFETFGNLRPVRELPGVRTPFTGRHLDIVVVRENVEDLYTGIEYMQTPAVAESLKLVSRKGCEKIVQLAFEFAVAAGRSRVHCATKANIMKLSEGLLQHTFEEMASSYPQIASKHILIDNCAHQLAMRPEQFDVIVTTNMNGDILSDLTSGLTGGLGFAPSANIGNDVSIFEAVHGSAPDIAGKGIANPTALIFSAAMMLRHIGEGKAANDIEQAILVTLESGVRSSDMAGDAKPSSTSEFADEVIGNLGRKSIASPAREYSALKLPPRSDVVHTVRAASRRVVGLDVYIESELLPDELGGAVERAVKGSSLSLLMISNRGTVVYPSIETRVGLVDHYRCRFVPSEPRNDVSDRDLIDLLSKLDGMRWMHVEKLQQFDGVDAFSKSGGGG